jgi:hypothetical protein
LPVTICTSYDDHFSDPQLQIVVSGARRRSNDATIRAA